MGESYLSKPEIQFWTPIIIYAVTLASSFFILSGKIDLLAQEVKTNTDYFASYRVERLEPIIILAQQNKVDIARIKDMLKIQ